MGSKRGRNSMSLQKKKTIEINKQEKGQTKEETRPDLEISVKENKETEKEPNWKEREKKKEEGIPLQEITNSSKGENASMARRWKKQAREIPNDTERKIEKENKAQKRKTIDRDEMEIKDRETKSKKQFSGNKIETVEAVEQPRRDQ
ncbi:uncharacterized protein DS421_16g555890 [Arachis hypogaea]|nr:uncharacterized protein DS421_16g555890 [Arachis hypogaea]